MATAPRFVRSTVTGFLPSVVVVILLVPVIEPIVRRHDVLTSLRSLYLPLVIGEPLLMALGYGVGLGLIQRKLGAQSIARTSRHIAAGVASVVFLGLTSVFSQGAHLSFIVASSVSAGLVSALLFFPVRPSPPLAAHTTPAA